jgi:hypothetical protein
MTFATTKLQDKSVANELFEASAAISVRVVAPAFWASPMIGRTLAANLC